MSMVLERRARPIRFYGSALEDLRAFPAASRREAGLQLEKVQEGEDPIDWRSVGSVGRGVREIRIWESGGAFRTIYVVEFDSVVYVLHCY
jgi:phage-related protein